MPCNLDALKLRADIYQKIRAFFKSKDVLEVETPLLCQHTVTDPYIDSFAVSTDKQDYYLQTSPEYAMKRLLSNGSGSIFQICKAFRYGEAGIQHNPEFTMLEWYHVGFGQQDLINEIDELLQRLLDTKPCDKISYQDLFQKHLDINPHDSNIETLKNISATHNIDITEANYSIDDWLQILMSHLIEPKIGLEKPIAIYDYPAGQAALAKIRQDKFPVAERFEFYYQGLELANGFHELNDSSEQQNRFEMDLEKRKILEKFKPELDSRFLDCLDNLPDCSGVAMGIDRLLMLISGQKFIKNVLSFDWNA